MLAEPPNFDYHHQVACWSVVYDKTKSVQSSQLGCCSNSSCHAQSFVEFFISKLVAVLVCGAAALLVSQWWLSMMEISLVAAQMDITAQVRTLEWDWMWLYLDSQWLGCILPPLPVSGWMSKSLPLIGTDGSPPAATSLSDAWLLA